MPKGVVNKNLYSLSVFTAISGAWIEKGLLYIFIAAVLLLALWWLNRLKVKEPKRAEK